jgi:hypothetical protein
MKISTKFSAAAPAQIMRLNKSLKLNRLEVLGVNMPSKNRRSPAMRAPAFGDGADFLFGRPYRKL